MQLNRNFNSRFPVPSGAYSIAIRSVNLNDMQSLCANAATATPISRFSHVWRMHPAIHVQDSHSRHSKIFEQFGNSLELKLILVRLRIVRLKIAIFRSA